jgi:FrmR/RcnR family transcriptional regulator, repressor of frmRAB operon
LAAGLPDAKSKIMAHTVRDKQKLLHRVRRLRGQVEALERLLDREADCSRTLHLLAACRGALNGLMIEVLEGHIRFHVVGGGRKPTAAQGRAAEEAIAVLKTYLR